MREWQGALPLLQLQKLLPHWHGAGLLPGALSLRCQQ
jgi:hypothetical protein